jgi:hypothetical protein
VFSHGKRSERSLSGLFGKSINPIHDCSSRILNHLPKASHPTTVTLRIRISTYDSRGDTNIQTIAVFNVKKYHKSNISFKCPLENRTHQTLVTCFSSLLIRMNSMCKEMVYITGCWILTHRSENLGHKGENAADFLDVL